MVKDLPAVTGNDRAVCTPDGFAIALRPVTEKDILNGYYAGAAEPFSVEHIEEPTSEDIAFEQMKLNNASVASRRQWRKAARGEQSALKYAEDRTIGPVVQKTASTNLNISLVEFLQKEELNDATDMELAEAGIVIDVEVMNAEENYARDL